MSLFELHDIKEGIPGGISYFELQDIKGGVPQGVAWFDLEDLKLITEEIKGDSTMFLPIEWRYGDQDQVNFIPATDVGAGTVVQVGNNLTGITNLDVQADTLGVISTAGVFEMMKDNVAFASGSAVYWISASKKATTVSAGNIFIGVAVLDAIATDETVYVQVRQKTPVII